MAGSFLEIWKWEMIFHIIKKNLEADKKDLRDINNEFDECLIDKVGIVDHDE